MNPEDGTRALLDFRCQNSALPIGGSVAFVDNEVFLDRLPFQSRHACKQKNCQRRQEISIAERVFFHDLNNVSGAKKGDQRKNTIYTVKALAS